MSIPYPQFEDKKNHVAYLAPAGFTHLLQKELQGIENIYGQLILTKVPEQKVYWYQNIWHNAQLLHIESIGAAAKYLRSIQRNWWPYSFHLHRRMQLIQDKLPHISPKPLDFLASTPSAPLGSWTLLDENTLLATSHCSSPVPNGEWVFNEDKINPPSRAYLKLWEFFTRFGKYPAKNEVCLDLGASPGGWTWVLSQLGAQVYAYDRSPLAPTVMNQKNVHFEKKDAFKVSLQDHSDAAWVFSDVICYPDKLYQFAQKCLYEYPDKKYVFTIKFQGIDHYDSIARFSQLPGQLVHLSQNKHELTWFKI